MTKILVVDDEPDLEVLIRQKFRKQIRENTYSFMFSSNGREALSVLDDHANAIDLVLSDINMPEMDGLSLLNKIGEGHPLVKSVMVSAYGDMENIRTAMNLGAFDFVCKPVNFEDLELTIEKTIVHISQVKTTLQAIKENNILRMYVDDNVLSFMASKEFENSLNQNENIEGTVVFMDICGFTAITEKEDPNFVIKLINHYFEIMVKEILAQGGVVDKFMGDAVMAVFKGEFHLDRAIDASIAVRNEINKQDQDAFMPKVAIGINSGEMISGNIGSAALKRLDFTVIGDNVNVAQRLQGSAIANQILISEAAYGQIKDSFKCEYVGEISLKNKSLSVPVYEVIE